VFPDLIILVYRNHGEISMTKSTNRFRQSVLCFNPLGSLAAGSWSTSHSALRLCDCLLGWSHLAICGWTTLLGGTILMTVSLIEIVFYISALSDSNTTLIMDAGGGIRTCLPPTGGHACWLSSFSTSIHHLRSAVAIVGKPVRLRQECQRHSSPPLMGLK
jgi:hypothetical protein